MGIPHKAFDFKGIVLCLILIVAVFLQNQVFAQENPLFVIEGVTVDETAESSVAAQQKAFEEAQVKAFDLLAVRMVQASSAKPLKAPDISAISAMIKDFEVTNEQISAVRYVGTYTFRFREEDVKQYFSVTGVSYTATASRPLLVLPFYQIGNQNTIWGDNNLWLAAWSRANLQSGLVPVTVPIGDLMDVGDISDSQGLNYDVGRLSGMQERYGASESAILMASPDSLLAKVPIDTDKAFGVLQISIYRTDLGAPQFVQQLSVIADKTETRAQLFDRAVLMAYQALQSDWKTKTSSSAEQAKGYDVKIPIKNLSDWVRIQKLLNSVPGMNEIVVKAVSPREARAYLNFRGDDLHLRDMLKQVGMGLSDGIPDGAGVLFYTLEPDIAQQPDDFYNPPDVGEEGDNGIQDKKLPDGSTDFYEGPDDDMDSGVSIDSIENQDGGMVQTF